MYVGKEVNPWGDIYFCIPIRLHLVIHFRKDEENEIEMVYAFHRSRADAGPGFIVIRVRGGTCHPGIARRFDR
jgi:hypothetical protein